MRWIRRLLQQRQDVVLLVLQCGLISVAFAKGRDVGVRALSKEEFDYILVAALRSRADGVAVDFGGFVDVGAVGEKQLDDFHVAVQGGGDEGAAVADIGFVGIRTVMEEEGGCRMVLLARSIRRSDFAKGYEICRNGTFPQAEKLTGYCSNRSSQRLIGLCLH